MLVEAGKPPGLGFPSVVIHVKRADADILPWILRLYQDHVHHDWQKNLKCITLPHPEKANTLYFQMCGPMGLARMAAAWRGQYGQNGVRYADPICSLARAPLTLA